MYWYNGDEHDVVWNNSPQYYYDDTNNTPSKYTYDCGNNNILSFYLLWKQVQVRVLDDDHNDVIVDHHASDNDHNFERLIFSAITCVACKFKNTNLRINTAKNGLMLYKSTNIYLRQWQCCYLYYRLVGLKLPRSTLQWIWSQGLQNSGFWLFTTEISNWQCPILTRINRSNYVRIQES